jgi:hypothetical protein
MDSNCPGLRALYVQLCGLYCTVLYSNAVQCNPPRLLDAAFLGECARLVMVLNALSKLLLGPPSAALLSPPPPPRGFVPTAYVLLNRRCSSGG